MPLTVLTDDEQMFKDSVARFAADVIEPSARHMDETGAMTPAVIRGLFDNGVRGLAQLLEVGGERRF